MPFNGFFEKYKKEEEGWVTISVWRRILPSICAQTAHYAWASAALPLKHARTSLSTLTVLQSVTPCRKMVKHRCEIAQIPLQWMQLHQSQKLLPRLDFEGSTAESWKAYRTIYLFIYLFLMRLIHKREWSDRLTPHHCWPGANFARLFLSLF